MILIDCETQKILLLIEVHSQSHLVRHIRIESDKNGTSSCVDTSNLFSNLEFYLAARIKFQVGCVDANLSLHSWLIKA